MWGDENIADAWMYQYPDVDDGPKEWHRTRPYHQYTTTISWAALAHEAEKAYYWACEQPGAWTRGGPIQHGSCLVSALFLPRPDGGVIFFSTIGRGKRAHEIMLLKNPREVAPVWLAAHDGQPKAIHCEDGSCYDFEKFNTELPDDDTNKMRMLWQRDEPYRGYGPRDTRAGMNNRPLEMRIAIFGARNGATGYVGLQLPCNDCQTVLRRLKVRWCTRELLQQEAAAGGPEAAGGSGAAAGGGYGGAGTGFGGPGGHYGSGSGAGTGSGTGHGGTAYGSHAPQGGSHATHNSHPGATSHSYDIANHMSGLSIDPRTQFGRSKGRLTSNDVFVALGAIGPGEMDNYGHPVYHGIVYDKTKNATSLPVTVDVYGTTIKQRQYFCFNSEGSAFDKPPKVSPKDPNRERAEKLYKMALALYSGEMAAAPMPQDHHDPPQIHQGHHPAYGHAGGAYPVHDHASPSTAYRPSTASSGGSSGEYTTRPGSRDGATDHISYASVPRTAAHEGYAGAHHESYVAAHHDQYGAHQDAAGSHPSGSGNADPSHSSVPKSVSGPAGGGPGKTSAAGQTTPVPPRNVKPDGSKRIGGTFTVHGIDKGRPYINVRNADKKKPDGKFELDYSKKNGKFFISLGPERNDRVYLKEA